MFFMRALAYVCIITSYVTIVHGTTSTSVLATKPRFNMKLRNALMLNSIPGKSFEECLKECIARGKCRSISYKRTAHHCYLGTEDAITNSSNLVTSQGYIYSDRTNWNMTGDVGCTKAQTCLKTGSGLKSELTECGSAPEKQNTTKFGNMMVVGSIVKYVCSTDPCSVGFSTCQKDGQWSNLNDAVCKTDLLKLEGQKFHITSDSTNKWWHTDSKGDYWPITTLWGQGKRSDFFTEFSFVGERNGTNRYKIRMNGTESFVIERFTSFFTDHSKNQQKADIFTIYPSCKSFRLFHEKTQSFVYVKIDDITTSGVSTYGSTLFRFEKL